MPAAFNRRDDLSVIDSNSFVIILITDGCVTLMINDCKCYVGPNTVLLLNKDCTVKVLSSQGLRARSISFEPAFINVNLNWNMIGRGDYEQIRKEFGFPSFELFFDTEMQGRVFPLQGDALTTADCLINSIINELGAQPDNFWSCRARAVIFQLFDVLESYCRELVSSEKSGDYIVLKAIDYISQNIGRKFSVTEICNAINTNHTTLNERFSSVTGLCVSEFIISKRMEMARQFLMFTSLNIAEIAHLCGYTDVSYFTRAFRKTVGETPLKYRKISVEKRKEKLQ